jgi:hypothetical protein
MLVLFGGITALPFAANIIYQSFIFDNKRYKENETEAN